MSLLAANVEEIRKLLKAIERDLGHIDCECHAETFLTRTFLVDIDCYTKEIQTQIRISLDKISFE